jgi:hypothetical protein
MLLFPVKLAQNACFVGWAFAVAGCGYLSVFSSPSAAETLTVEAAPFAAPDLGAVQAALAGARAELSRAGQLRSGDAYPRLMLELVRIDELPAGMVSSSLAPVGRGSNVGVTGHAWVLERDGGERLRDTGDVRRVETVAQDGTPVPDSVAFAMAAHSAAREVGAALARRAMGAPEPSVDPM